MNNSTQRLNPTNPFIPFTKEEIEQSIPERFANVVRTYPDRPAIQGDNETLTYRELDETSNQVAHAIRTKFGTESEPVAMILDHGAAPVISILGILKAGKFYVALDPTSARSRLASILDDIQTRILVTNRDNSSLAHELSPDGCVLLNFDDLEPTHSDSKVNLSLSTSSLAAVFYTSGSTGEPKGVMNAHRNILHGAKLITNSSHVCSDDRLALLFSYSFSWSKSILFSVLLNGGTVFPFDIKREGLANLTDWLIRNEITIFSSVTSVFRNFTETLTGEDAIPKLRLISIGGEKVCRRDVEFYKKHFPQACLLKLSYGMTEACSVVASIFIDGTTDIIGDIMPVGYPSEDTEIILLDDTGEEVGYDHIGEIVIRSRYLSPGYWNKTELTARTFQPVPGADGVRMYRTGDVGRFSSDGCLYHLGRKDFQVKVRGHRIETEEVERSLVHLDGISSAAVVTHPDVRGENRLVAYIVCNLTPKLTVTQLRTLLKETLPEYMIPSSYVFMDTLPTTTSGKVDITALPAPDTSKPELDSHFIAPRTSMEKRLANLWAEILDVSPVGIRDDFFDLGGHSLQAAHLFTYIERSFGKKLPVSILFEAPTIEKLSAVLIKEAGSESWSSLVPIQTGGSKRPVFCVHNLSGDVVTYAELARNLGSDQPFYGLRARGLDGVQKPYTRIEAMASDYIREIRTVQPEGPYVLSGMCFGSIVAFEMAQQLHAQGQEVGQLFLLDAPCPPFPLKHRLSFTLERFTRHFRDDILGFLRRSSHNSNTSKQQSLLKRHRSISHILKILRVDRANNRAFRKYRPQYYPGQIIHFLVSQPIVACSPDSRQAWKTYADGVEEHTLSGDHHTLLREPRVRRLAEMIQECMERT